MKKFVAFVMILSLGLFCAVGCNKPAAKPKDKAGVEKKEDVKKEEPKAGGEAAKEEPAAKPEEKAPETK